MELPYITACAAALIDPDRSEGVWPLLHAEMKSLYGSQHALWFDKSGARDGYGPIFYYKLVVFDNGMVQPSGVLVKGTVHECCRYILDHQDELRRLP